MEGGKERGHARSRERCFREHPKPRRHTLTQSSQCGVWSRREKGTREMLCRTHAICVHPGHDKRMFMEPPINYCPQAILSIFLLDHLENDDPTLFFRHHLPRRLSTYVPIAIGWFTRCLIILLTPCMLFHAKKKHDRASTKLEPGNNDEGETWNTKLC